MGAIAGIVGTAFRGVLVGGDSLRDTLIAWSRHFPALGWVFPVLFCSFLAAVSVILVRSAAPEASGSGIPNLEAVLRGYRELRWKRVLPVKFVGGAMALGGGLALGREGPTVQMGGAAGAAVSDWLHTSSRDRLTLIAAGAGAGLAAAFNAPLAGVMFVLEEVQRDFRQAVFGSAFIAAVVADIVARIASGQIPVFRVPSYPISPLSALPAFALLGAVAGIMGVAYSKTLLAVIQQFARIPRRAGILATGIVGGLVGVVAWFAPEAVGGGHYLAEIVLQHPMALGAIPLWFLLRFALSMASYGCGAPGGIFAPMLALGALIGLGVGDCAHLAFPYAVPTAAPFAVIGMAAYFTAIVRAPITGVVLIVEMTGSYAQMLPLLVSCFCAYIVAEAMGQLPIYESLLQRDLLQNGHGPVVGESRVIDLEVEPGSPFEGHAVRDLGLPSGCILVSYRNGGLERVPTAATVLEAHARITVIVSPEAEGATEALRVGCEVVGAE